MTSKCTNVRNACTIDCKGCLGFLLKENHLVYRSAELCIENFSFECFEYILERGLDPNIRDSYTQFTCLHYISRHLIQIPQKIKISKILLEKGADINSKDILGRTPLHLACEQDDDNFIRFLLDNGADWNVYDKLQKLPSDFSNRAKNIIEDWIDMDCISIKTPDC